MEDTGRLSPPNLDSAEGYRLLVDSIADYAIFMLDPDGIVVTWNPGAERVNGYRRGEILGQSFSRFYTQEDVANGLPEQALRTARDEGRFENEGWRVRKDGTRFWAHELISPITGPDGKLIGFAKVTRDVTDRRNTEMALRLSEQRFRYLVQGVTDYAIYMLDPNGIVTNWNSGAERIKGYTADEIIGEHFSKFYTDEDRLKGEPERALGIARQAGRFEKAEGIRVRKDGTRFWANVVIDAIHNEDGELIGFAKVTRDITERKQAEMALAQTNAELLQSQKMEAIGRLTGGVAHDFNNLLMAISASLELLRKRMPDDPRLQRLVDNAMQGASRGAALTQRMLAFARRQELRPESADIKKLVDGMTEMLARSLGPSITIETSFAANLPPVMIDVNQLELAVLNLALNARDAMAHGGHLEISGETRTVTGRSDLADGEYVCLTLADTGTGMDAETLSHATEPFFTTKGVGKGTGLGLAMVRGLSEQSGGTVTIESEPDVGTQVTMWIPVSRSPTVATAPAPAQTQAPSPRRLRIVVVDDDFLVAMNTSEMLQDLGHEVFETHTGALALKALQENGPFDLLITDQAMPHMTGTQLIEAVRKLYPDLPVVLATGYAELPEQADQAIPRLGKPFMQSDLERILERVMSPTEAAT